MKKRSNVVILLLTGSAEKKLVFFSKHNLSVHFEPGNTPGQKLVPPKDKTLGTTNGAAWPVPKKTQPYYTGANSRQPGTIDRKSHGFRDTKAPLLGQQRTPPLLP